MALAGWRHQLQGLPQGWAGWQLPAGTMGSAGGRPAGALRGQASTSGCRQRGWRFGLPCGDLVLKIPTSTLPPPLRRVPVQRGRVERRGGRRPVHHVLHQLPRLHLRRLLVLQRGGAHWNHGEPGAAWRPPHPPTPTPPHTPCPLLMSTARTGPYLAACEDGHFPLAARRRTRWPDTPSAVCPAPGAPLLPLRPTCLVPPRR